MNCGFTLHILLTFQVDIAGKMVPMEPLICLRRGHAQLYKAAIKVGAESVSLRAGDQVPFALQYYDYRFGADTVREINSVTPPNRPVYYRRGIYVFIEGKLGLVDLEVKLSDKTK